MVQLLPQVWKSWRDKSTEGLSEYIGFARDMFYLNKHLIIQQTSLGNIWSVLGCICDRTGPEYTAHRAASSPVGSLARIVGAGDISMAIPQHATKVAYVVPVLWQEAFVANMCAGSDFHPACTGRLRGWHGLRDPSTPSYCSSVPLTWKLIRLYQTAGLP